MTTPDPITTAREALERIHSLAADHPAADDTYADRDIVIEALEKLKAERDEALTQIGLLGVQIETIRGLKATEALNEITRLTSQLEQAETILADLAKQIRPDLLDRLSDDVMFEFSVRLPRAAAKWYKDRQAKGEG